MKIGKIIVTVCVAAQLLCSTAIMSNCVYADGNAPLSNSSVVYGDVTGDAMVDSADYSLMKKYLLGKITDMEAPNWKITGDLNLDGIIDMADYSILRKYLINVITSLPLGAEHKLTSPSCISTSAVGTNISVTWDAVKDAASYDLAIDEQAPISVTGTVYKHEGVKANTEHTYRIRAVNTKATSEWVAVLKISAPEVPNWEGRHTSATISGSREESCILFCWNKVENATGYIVSINGKEVKTTEDAYDYEGCDFSIPNRFKLKAVNDYGESDWSEEYVVDAR